MAIPWLRVIDAVLGVNDIVRRVKGRSADADARQLTSGTSVAPAVEARLAGVVVAALREAFDRDSRRVELERQQLEAERQRAERAMRLELLRQAGDREIGRLRLVAGVALASWLGTLLLASRLLGGIGGRVTLGIGWFLLLVAIASAFTEQSRIARNLAAGDDRLSVESLTGGSPGSVLAPWFVVGGLAVTAVGMLIS